MTYTDMAVELEKLPLVERLALIERLTHSVRFEGYVAGITSVNLFYIAAKIKGAGAACGSPRIAGRLSGVSD